MRLAVSLEVSEEVDPKYPMETVSRRYRCSFFEERQEGVVVEKAVVGMACRIVR
jgi:hypothetical protein